MKKFKPYENQMEYLVGGSRLPATPGERELEHKCNPHPNDWIDGIYYYRGRSQMTMNEKISNPLSVEEALELSEKIRKGIITDYWVKDTDGLGYNSLPFAVRMSKGLVTQIEEARRKNFIGEYRDIISSCGGSDAPYFADRIVEPIEKFNATHFPDGREKSKAVTM